MNTFAEALAELFQAKAFPPDAFYLKQAFVGRPLVVYGAGECSHWFFEIIMKMNGFMPMAILDRRFQPGDSWNGIPAYPPVNYHPGEAEKREGIVVICVGSQAHFAEMKQNVQALGFQNILSLRDVYEIHNPFSQPVALREQGFAYYLQEKERILQALDLFGDDLSREIYLKCLATHMTRKPVALPMRPRREQYFPTDITLGRGHARYICCGSYDGDTVRLLHETVGKVEGIICFEPEPSIFERLVAYLRAQKQELADTLIAMPCAVYGQDGLRPFLSGTGLGSRIAEEGEATVQCVTLDHALPGFSPTFISMDVEGAELEVLKGAEQMLREHRPDLGVCTYHAPNHLWELPLFLRSLDLGYRLFLRNYTTYVSETVLYATIA